MCGIAGFFNPYMDYKTEELKWKHILEEMNRAQKRRGPDDEGTYLSPICALAHVRLEIIDLKTGHQPMIRRTQGRECAIVFNGEIYNMAELKAELILEGADFHTPRKRLYQKTERHLRHCTVGLCSPGTLPVPRQAWH